MVTSPSAGVKKTRPANVTPPTTPNKTPKKTPMKTASHCDSPKPLQRNPTCTMKQGKPALHRPAKKSLKPLLQETENKEVRGPLLAIIYQISIDLLLFIFHLFF